MPLSLLFSYHSSSETYRGECHRKLSSLRNATGDEYRPHCKPDGRFEEKQCDASSGYCWCVDENTGTPINGTKRGPHEWNITCGKSGYIIETSSIKGLYAVRA